MYRKKCPSRWAIRILLVLFIWLGVIYSLITPPFESPDEAYHYPVIQYIAKHGQLPRMDPASPGPWRQEAGQAPLYYLLNAALTFWIDASDMGQVRYLNPHVDLGVPKPDGNINMVVHNPAIERFPWHGTVLAIHLIRLISVMMGAISVYLTFRIARMILADNVCLPIIVAAVHAFTPMFIFISASVNNDNLVVMLSNLVLFLLLRINGSLYTWKQNWLQYISVGSVLGLAALSKTSALGLTLVTALVIIMRSIRLRSWGELIFGGIGTLFPFLSISGWWYYRNIRLYGSPTGINVFIQIVGKRNDYADLAQLWSERHGFLASYWGNFGWMNVLLPSFVYRFFGILLIIAFLGILVRIFRIVEPPKFTATSQLVVVLSWGFILMTTWLWWTHVTPATQGRLIFPAISVWSLLFVAGLYAFSQAMTRTFSFVSQPIKHFYLILPTSLFAVALLAPFVWIRPAYQPPKALSSEEISVIPHPMAIDFDNTLRQIG